MGPKKAEKDSPGESSGADMENSTPATSSSKELVLHTSTKFNVDTPSTLYGPSMLVSYELADDFYQLSTTNTEIALGIPGQADGLATLQSDRGDEVQALFRYQWSAGVVLLVAAYAEKNQYQAVWCEHHDDLLAELPNGNFHAVQVKTKHHDAPWKAMDGGFLDAIEKFCRHEDAFSQKLEQYIFFSNRRPYIPGPTAHKAETLATSPVRIAQTCCRAASRHDIPEPYKTSFEGVAARTGCAADTVFRVFQKLLFYRGVPLEAYREHLGVFVGGLPECRSLTHQRIKEISDDLLLMVGDSSSLEVSSIDLYSTVLQSDGRPLAQVRGKRLSVEEVAIRLRQRQDSGFRYADVGGYLQLGQANGQKAVLQKKMTAGYVGNYFPGIWLQALGAEQKLMEEAIAEPERTLKKIKQLQSVMLVACQNAEVEAALEADERKRGVLILQNIFAQTKLLAEHDAATVEHERVETLRGIAGLLSGSCHFAWGVPFVGGSDGT